MPIDGSRQPGLTLTALLFCLSASVASAGSGPALVDDEPDRATMPIAAGDIVVLKGPEVFLVEGEIPRHDNDTRQRPIPAKGARTNDRFQVETGCCTGLTSLRRSARTFRSHRLTTTDRVVFHPSISFAPMTPSPTSTSGSPTRKRCRRVLDAGKALARAKGSTTRQSRHRPGDRDRAHASRALCNA